MQYNFEWDPQKALLNNRKHKIRFEQAATVFFDPNTLTIFDDDHSEKEERWVTLGLDSNGTLIVVCHTFKENTDSSTIRIYSSRKATKNEIKQYQDNIK
jgi:uncharacterized DUF497 family protein